ncbi:predicted protein [Histoplasma capsulatum H143]|uniref:Uncharacterized protein n=1 Tax=Ajellomyces capsulatus (strain H143) TaxID=544712 RepID=C6HER3_AJECH|nr:predicted protein [Histoplasma capsulatum H143]
MPTTAAHQAMFKLLCKSRILMSFFPTMAHCACNRSSDSNFSEQASTLHTTEQPIVEDLESDGENSPNDTQPRRTIGRDMRTGATGRGIMYTSSSPEAKSEPGTPANPGKRDGKETLLTPRGQGKYSQKNNEK